MARLNLPRPFLKWAGGKTQIADDLVERIPHKFAAYHEPFVGGGALFFRLYRDRHVRQAVLSDLNNELIDTYIAVRDHVEEIIDILSGYPHDKAFYYDLRAVDPMEVELPVRAARIIYLNKTGYNGLYRVNKKGEFNVPFGRYQSPKYCDPKNLRAVSMALEDVEIICDSFESVLERAKPGDLVYFDPPYVPVSGTANFTAYHVDGFSNDHQVILRNVCLELTKKGVHVMLSNSDTDTVRELYAAPDFVLDVVQANRAINSNAKRRGKLTELIVTNYQLEKAH